MSEDKIRTICELDDEYLQLTSYYYQKFSGKNEVPMNTHNRFEIMLIEYGSFMIRFADNNGWESEKIYLKKGQAILIDCNLVHGMEIAEDSRIYNVEFSPVPVSEAPFSVLPYGKIFKENAAVRYMLSHNKRGYYICNDFVRLKAIMIQMFAEVDENAQKPSIESLMMSNLLIQQLMFIFSRSFMEHHMANGILYVREVNRYIARNYQNNISVKDIAAEIGLNVTYMQKFYKKHEGRTISETLTKFRIKKAAYLIRNTSLCLLDVAISVGFNSRQVFFENFRRVTGISPSQYKKSVSKNQRKIFSEGEFIDNIDNGG